MNGNGAYRDEMIVTFERAMRAAVPVRPDPQLAAELIPRLAQAAGASTVELERTTTRRPVRFRPTLVARIAMAVAAVPLLLAGLAFAGVTLPKPVRSAFDSVGIELPNQPASSTTEQGSGETRSAAKATATKGSATAGKGKSAAAHKHALQQHQKAKGKALGHSHGRAIGVNGLTPPGQSGQTGPPSHSHNGGGSSHSHAPPAFHVPNGRANGHSK